MKRLLSVLVAAVVAFAGVRGFAQAQSADLPTVDQVLDKYVTALGGRAAFEKLTSRVSKGTVEIPDASISGTIEVSEKAPDKSLTVISLQGMVMREGADTSGAWQDDPTMGIQDKKGDELASAKRDSTFNSEIKMKDIYKTLAVTAKDTVGGKPAYVVLATPAQGMPTRFYFDADSGMLVKLHSTRDTPQGPIDVDVLLEDFRVVDGIKVPFTVRQVTSMFTMVVHMTDIKHNVALDDAIFKKPGSGDLRGTILPVAR
jgi:hypothetical protein